MGTRKANEKVATATDPHFMVVFFGCGLRPSLSADSNLYFGFGWLRLCDINIYFTVYYTIVIIIWTASQGA